MGSDQAPEVYGLVIASGIYYASFSSEPPPPWAVARGS
jgi:hypothetical protein